MVKENLSLLGLRQQATQDLRSPFLSDVTKETGLTIQNGGLNQYFSFINRIYALLNSQKYDE